MRKVAITKSSIKVEGRFKRQGSALRGTLKGSCDGFDIQLALESDADPHAVSGVVRLAHESCFTEAALQNATPVHKQATLNGQPLD